MRFFRLFALTLFFSEFFFLSLILSGCVHERPKVIREKEKLVDLVRDDFAPWSRDVASVTKKSGYALSDATCGPFPKIQLGTRQGYCAGLVASKDDGLVFPRSLVQVPGSRFFVVVDMGGWGKNLGRILLLDPDAEPGRRIRILVDQLDAPHGIAVGVDKKIYVGAIDKVIRIDPLSPDPARSVEVILQNLKGRDLKLPDGSRLEKSSHPLKNFVFDQSGRLFINMGAPTDSCLESASLQKPCWSDEGPSPLAAIWVYTPQAGRVFSALKPGDANPKFEVYSTGLRNSMALAAHEKFPEPGYAFFQGENARDLPDPLKPNEELNSLERGKHYGWPYCYDNDSESPEFAGLMKSAGRYQGFCSKSGAGTYQPPYSLLPPHSAPLGMTYYNGRKFPELQGALLISLHGYRPTGSRLIFFAADEKGFPKSEPPPVTYSVSCAAEENRPYQTEKVAQVPAAPFKEIVAEWHKVNGIRPQGAPVGVAVADDGAIWVVEDKNQTIFRFDTDNNKDVERLPCDSRSEEQIKELMGFVAKNPANRERITRIRTQFVEKRCIECHAGFNIKPEMNDAQKDGAVARFMFGQDGWIFPGDPGSGRLHRRTWAIGSERPMPGNAAELIKNEPGYKELLHTLDQFVATLVPGERKRIQLQTSPSLKFRNNRDIVCGSIAADTVVVVVDESPREKPGFSRIYRPADRFLNGQCADSEGYYVASKYLGKVPGPR